VGTNRLVACPLSDGRVQVWASGDGKVSTLWKTGVDPDSSWTPWQTFNTGSAGTEIVSAVRAANGAVVLFGLSPNPAEPGPWAVTAHKVSADANAAWSSWTIVFGQGDVFDVTAGLLEDGRMQQFASVRLGGFGGSLHVQTNWRDSSDPASGLSRTSDMTGDGVAPVTLVAVTLSDGRLQLVGADNGTLLTAFKLGVDPNAAWSPWEQFPGTPQADSSVQLAWASLPDGRPQIFSVNKFGDVQSTWKESTDPNSGWVTWQPFQAPANLVAIAAAPLSDRRIQLFAADQGGNLFSTWKLSADPNAAWQSWQDFARP
jgi:hypothetical protein